jgi:hypothetical protein
VAVTSFLLQLAAVTHLHVAHQAMSARFVGAAKSAGADVTRAAAANSEDHPPACPICLVRAQTHTIIAAALSAAPALIDAPALALPAAVPATATVAGPAAPRGPPTSRS